MPEPEKLESKGSLPDATSSTFTNRFYKAATRLEGVSQGCLSRILDAY